MSSFEDILSRPTVFANRDVLSPNYVPDILPFREREVERIMKIISPALKGHQPHNLFIYGKTGTGKTASVKHVMEKFKEMNIPTAKMCYVNCRMYNTRYRVMQKVAKTYIPGLDKAGFGLPFIYEKLLAWINDNRIRLIIVLDEIDMVHDLDDLIYSLTRANDELEHGSISMIGISNKLSFKEQLDPRSRSSLYETEMVFAPYTAVQLQEILRQRVRLGFKEGVVSPSAINLAAAITAQETGDARYALRLLLRAGDIADEKGIGKVTDKEVEEARQSVEEDLAAETISTLPEHQQLVLLAIANLILSGSKYRRISQVSGSEGEDVLFSGEVYEEYERLCKEYSKHPRTTRWLRDYLNDLEMLGLITLTTSGKGVRGHTRFVKLGYPAESIRRVVLRLLNSRREYVSDYKMTGR